MDAYDQSHYRHLKLRLEHAPAGSIGSILWVTLDRPASLNSLSAELTAELHQLLDALQHPGSMLQPVDPAFPRVLVLRGSGGRAFSAGVDIMSADQGIGGQAYDYRDMRSQQLLSRLIEKLRAIPQPVIAAVQGVAAGAGLALALASDVRVATRSSSFSAAFVKLGLTGTDMGTSFFLPRIAGQGIASEMLLTGRPLSAERAYQVGLVNEMTEDDPAALEAVVRRLARDMLALSSKGLQLTKEQLHSTAEGGSLHAALAGENNHQMLLVNDPKAAAAAQAWVASMLARSKRRAEGSGRGDVGGSRTSSAAGPRPKL